jgi:hypothetical protein
LLPRTSLASGNVHTYSNACAALARERGAARRELRIAEGPGALPRGHCGLPCGGDQWEYLFAAPRLQALLPARQRWAPVAAESRRGEGGRPRTATLLARPTPERQLQQRKTAQFIKCEPPQPRSALRASECARLSSTRCDGRLELQRQQPTCGSGEQCITRKRSAAPIKRVVRILQDRFSPVLVRNLAANRQRLC